MSSREHRHFIATDYQCSPECPAYGRPICEPPRVHVDTHQERLRAIEAVPQTLRFALEGRPYYIGRLWETWWAFATLPPTRWLED